MKRYEEYRVDAFYPTIELATGAQVSDIEHEVVEPLTVPLGQIGLFTNDYRSYDGEVQTREQIGDPLTNSIDITLRDRTSTVDEAKATIHVRTINDEGRFLQARKKLYALKRSYRRAQEAFLDPCAAGARGNHCFCAVLSRYGMCKADMDDWVDWLAIPAAEIENGIARPVVVPLRQTERTDDSVLRRSRPATKIPFRKSQSINNASHMRVAAVKRARSVQRTDCLDVVLEELGTLFVGQSWDVYWIESHISGAIQAALRKLEKLSGLVEVEVSSLE
ncbi:hypothetical protein EJ05DRAFT_538316 [Pseudovirgaria hyperparasitica]|uniref:Uncharacterized protein n=1 Tax=Pseudovirgaria hyperparasitica TaxID=470096 RepID=A0A6A6W7Z0_9PEZI|nr:uncharacterized protein EJ05DRAFT_538316 [Pseudovirgaria hyperparasitica]KAF2758070.1 hypothetical protein EJ05DRAFT_538316 [Pseudovirgaria hyperparasitica]